MLKGVKDFKWDNNQLKLTMIALRTSFRCDKNANKTNYTSFTS